MKKQKYFITTYPYFKLNYWAIPKCGNTAIKFSLMNPTVPSNYNTDSIYKKMKSMHNVKNIKTIDITEAQRNQFINFTVTRHPYNRVLSLFKDFGVRRPWKGAFSGKQVTLDRFIKLLCIEWCDDSVVKNHHAFSQNYYVTDLQNCNLLVDKVIDINNLDSFLLSKGIVPKMFNKSQPLDIKLKDNHKELIYERYKDDFRMFNYTK